jgi:agmatinase
MSGRE